MEIGRQLSTNQHEENPEVGLRNDRWAEWVKIRRLGAMEVGMGGKNLG